MTRHAKSNSQPIAYVDKVIPTGPHVLKQDTLIVSGELVKIYNRTETRKRLQALLVITPVFS